MNMASLAGNIGFKKISCQLSRRLYSIPWAIWKKQITCLKSRDYSSSVPAKYIPKTSSNLKLSETSRLVKSSEKSSCSSDANIRTSKISGGKFVHYEASQSLNEMQNNLLFDDSEQGCDQMEEIEEAVEELTIHQAGDSCEQDLLHIDKRISIVEESAIKLLAARALTTFQLRKKLHGKGFSSDAVEAVINKFQSKGLVNDSLYAESFSRSRWSSSSWGPRRIKQALTKKGVSQADAEKAVELIFKEEDSDVDEKSNIRLSKNSINQLYVQASRQWFRSLDVPKETRKSRVIRWLQYRGFDWDVIKLILKKLEKQDPP